MSSVVPPILAPLERLCRVYLSLDAAGRRPGDEDRRARALREPARGGRGPDRQRGRRARALAAGRDRRRLRHRDHVRRRHRARRIPGRRHRARPDACRRTRSTTRPRSCRASRSRARRRRSAATPSPACSPGWCSGTPGLVDAIVGRIKAEVDFAPRVVGTGGLAPLIAARGAQHRRVRRHADVARAGDHPRSQPVMATSSRRRRRCCGSPARVGQLATAPDAALARVEAEGGGLRDALALVVAAVVAFRLPELVHAVLTIAGPTSGAFMRLVALFAGRGAARRLVRAAGGGRRDVLRAQAARRRARSRPRRRLLPAGLRRRRASSARSRR